MSSKVFCVSQNHVAQRTNFYADIFLLNQVLEVWEQEELESVTDSLGSQKNGVVEVLAIPVVSFTRVEECWHSIFASSDTNISHNVEFLLRG